MSQLFTGILQRFLHRTKSLAGSISRFTGNLTRFLHRTKTLAGSLRFSATLAFSKGKAAQFISFFHVTGTLARRLHLKKAITGSLRFVGTLSIKTKQSLQSLVGSFHIAGNLIRASHVYRILNGYLIKDSLGSTFNRGDFTALNAFFWSSLDLSPYKGTDLGSTPYFIELIDGAGKKATGYIGAVGAGETLGSEICGDPGFDNDAYWFYKDAGWSVAASKAVALNVPNTGYLFGSATWIEGSLVKGSFDIELYTSGGVYLLVRSVLVGPFSGLGTKTGYKTVGNVAGYIGFSADGTLTATFDNYSQKRVTDPPATAVHIVSSLNGTIRNWASIESGFDPNTIASWEIYYPTKHKIFHQIGTLFRYIRNYRAISGSFHLSATLSRFLHRVKGLSGVSHYTGVLSRIFRQIRYFIGMTHQAGTLARLSHAYRLLSGSFHQTGILKKSFHISKVLTGSLHYTGSIVRAFYRRRFLTGTFTWIASLSVFRRVNRSTEGGMRMVGKVYVLSEQLYLGVPNPWPLT